MPPPKPRTHLVAPGECLASIAAAARTTPATLWDHPDNAELRTARKDPYVLAPGDKVAVPQPRAGAHTVEAGMRHVFRRHATHAAWRARRATVAAGRLMCS